IAADSRESLTMACRALDRVIRTGRYWVPHWYKPAHWLAYWDVFSRPATKPRYACGAPEIWWYDRDKAAKLEPGVRGRGASAGRGRRKQRTRRSRCASSTTDVHG